MYWKKVKNSKLMFSSSAAKLTRMFFFYNFYTLRSIFKTTTNLTSILFERTRWLIIVLIFQSQNHFSKKSHKRWRCCRGGAAPRSDRESLRSSTSWEYNLPSRWEISRSFGHFSTRSKAFLLNVSQREKISNNYEKEKKCLNCDEKCIEFYLDDKANPDHKNIPRIPYLRHTNLRHLFGKNRHQKNSDLRTPPTMLKNLDFDQFFLIFG